MATKKRFAELDGLRGIAAMLVVLFHYYYNFYAGGYNAFEGVQVGLFSLGKVGVDIFFMISGLVIFWSLDRVRTVGEFAYARFARLFPAYWVGVIVTFSVVSYFGLRGGGLLHQIS